ncbi:hypothetical protein CC85DRAFT_330771 [Cutaneotrichosporon oleaginosum]|uniref:Mediator of RNA polymerase II transcription subunit 13 n=1 Tax=Cutaneotrichosporon oleaginosum TaxID=879819 RepID=A0A0J1AVW1_9TREE|nr:uncharacterized protein CC85DRAFT_330771 [Cutaneotrichosporon oleaginosum]KLT39399.1 hypothetical protein CC85DRAFT_330771 [Cutaneotrichosporon oleaginosum]TXT07550.1 hypothetical protein COLE_04474 [Cutaneotrichosporon oleaginosum]
MAPDILAGQPLRPTTPIPGLWLLDAPETLYVRVYTAPPIVPCDPPPPETTGTPQPEQNGEEKPDASLSLSPARLAIPAVAPSPALSLPGIRSPTALRSPVAALKSQPGTPSQTEVKLSPTRTTHSFIPRPPSPSTTLDRLRNDPLERAWLAINASDSDVTAAVLKRPCAVVKPGGERRELWVFSPDDAPASALESLGLTEVDVPQPIRIADTVTCSEHGHTLDCLSPDTDDKCVPTFTPPESWPLLESAVGEKVAWKLGTRLSLLPSDATLADPPFDVSLRPAPGKLILTAQLRPLPSCAPQRHNRTDPGVDPLVLRPLALPALLVAPVGPTPAQDVRLSAAFDLALGSGWKNGRSEARVAAQAAHGCAYDWSVYWVPLERGEEDLARTLPHALATKWRGSNGVLTVWPTHLARPLARSLPPVPAKFVPPDSALGSPFDLMSIATEVFDFLGSYTAPAEDDDDDGEEEPPEANGDVAMDDGSKESDADDLFSAHTSPAPTASRAVSRAPTIGTDVGELFTSSAFGTPGLNALDVDMGLDEDLFGDDDADTVVPDREEAGDTTPAPVMLPPPIPTNTQLSSKVGSPREVTEDDFNFFDSPAAETSPAKIFHAPHPPLDDHTGKELAVLATPAAAYLSIPLPDATPASLSSALEDEPEALTEVQVQILPEPEVILTEAVEECMTKPSSPSIVLVEEEPRKRRYIDIVPDAFAPVQLGTSKRPKFAYGLPSPAATVSSLRLGCVERLRESVSGKEKAVAFPYTAAWDIESDGSDSECESAVTTGAPPTPSSTVSYDDRTPTNELAALPALPDDEVEYDGTVCIGGEWTSLQFDINAAATLARAWAVSWVDIRPEPDYPTPTSPPRLAEPQQPTLNVELFANAIVRNSFFRALFETSDVTARELPRPASMIVRGGVPVSDVAGALADSERYSLEQPSVHVGYGSNVMRVNVAALRYWRELGLMPSGGPKDLAAFVICAPGAYNVQRAQTFLTDISEVFEANRLGTLVAGAHELATDGVAAVPSVEVWSTASRLRGTSLVGKPTVVFVLTSTTTLSPASLVPLLAPKAQTNWVYPLPLSSLRPSNLATIAFQVYDLVPRHVDRVTMFGKPLDMPKLWMGFHAFTLAGEEAPKPELSMAWPQRSYDVLNRWRQVHAAYAWVPEWETAIVAVVDAQGDALDVQALKLEKCTTRDRVSRVWDVVLSFAAEAATEWRASITRYGLMSVDELDAWKWLYNGHTDAMSLLMCEPSSDGPNRTRAPVANIPPSTFADPSASIIDEALAASAASFNHRLCVTLPPGGTGSTPTIFPPASFALGMAGPAATSVATATYHVLLHRNPPGRSEKADELLAPEFYRLACLGRRRYALGALPLPLDAVGAVSAALGRIEKPVEAEVEKKEEDD